MADRELNRAGLDLIKRFERLRLKAYKDSAGVWTIGYGTTARAGVGIKPRPGMTITEVEAEHYLEKALRNTENAVNRLIRAPINENQFSAYVSLAYNIGVGAFARSSTLRYFNAGDVEQAAKNILLWNKITVDGKRRTSRGLVRRREAEQNLFLTPVVARTPKPAPAPGKRGFWAILMALIERIFK